MGVMLRNCTNEGKVGLSFVVGGGEGKSVPGQGRGEGRGEQNRNEQSAGPVLLPYIHHRRRYIHSYLPRVVYNRCIPINNIAPPPWSRSSITAVRARPGSSTFPLRDTFRFHTTLRSLPCFNACTPRSDHCIATDNHWTYRRSVRI